MGSHFIISLGTAFAYIKHKHSNFYILTTYYVDYYYGKCKYALLLSLLKAINLVPSFPYQNLTFTQLSFPIPTK